MTDSLPESRTPWSQPRPGGGTLHAREALPAAAGDQILCAWLAYRDDRAAVGEDDGFGITVQLTPEQANRLADLLAPSPDGGG
jgi:hypothetical protein